MGRVIPATLGVLALLLAECILAGSACAQDLEFHPPAQATDPAAWSAMRDLASRILPVYQERDQEKYLRNLSALQLVAHNYPAAYASRQSLLDRRRAADAKRPVNRSVIFDIYAHAKERESEEHLPFARAFAESYQDVVGKLSDADAYILTGWLAQPVAGFQDNLQRVFDQWRAKGSIPLNDAIELVWNYLSFDAYRNFHPLIASLNAEDDANRYVIDWDVLIDTPDHGKISAVLVRPKNDTNSLPALLEFTIYVDAHNFARECAAHGYVGIVAFTRGERRSPGKVVPFRTDGEDARSVIGWITKQPWSDGRVGMYGSTYSAFVAWAAAKHLPPALKAIAVTSATAPGVDVPMSGNIMRNWAFRWSGCVGNLEGFDDRLCADDSHWRGLDLAWYASGKAYRQLPAVYGLANPIFRSWMDHPSYDGFWQKLLPDAKELARLSIPVLATTGYYAPGEPGTLFTFSQLARANPHANQTLIVGPYDDGAMSYGPVANLQGYALDAAALVDLRELRYQWFDSIFKGSDPPALLKDRVNFEVMGANEWQHAPSIDSMGSASLRYFFDPGVRPPAAGATGKTAGPAPVPVLAQRKPPEAVYLRQTVDLADRSDAASWTAPYGVVSRSLAPRNALTYVSEPLRHTIEVDGLFSGKLDLRVNRVDMDLSIELYELLPDGEYVSLFAPADEFRASFATDRITRHLLRAGERQLLAFRSNRLTSRKLDAGSRIVVVLGLVKRPDRQINYGTAGVVDDESIAAGRVPVRIDWYGDSYIDLPISR